jgi:cytochrome c oxidase subunit 1
MYIVVVVGSILFGKRVEKALDLPIRATTEPAAVGHYGSAGTLKIPGTAILVAVFFTAFVLYYFVNWKYLSEVWPLR